MPYDRRFPAAPQLEIIHASDDTIRAELIALPVIRTRPTLVTRVAPVPALGESVDAPLPAA
jgi:hypothetical protein